MKLTDEIADQVREIGGENLTLGIERLAKFAMTLDIDVKKKLASE